MTGAGGSLEASTEVGALIGGCFRAECEIGRGAMGAVYRVLDERTGQRFALKRLYVGDERTRGMLTSLFEREYHTLAQFEHPCIIEVHDYGVDALGAYYTMELLDGADLRERGKLPWAEACALLRDVASSLAILHSRKLLHRDLSPRNVRCTSEGRGKLIDFGVMTPMGVSKTVVGTPPFVPPEALRQQTLDARADLFSLGALAYWSLTGRYAYPARTLNELRDVWRTAPAPPIKLEPSVPAALSDLVMALLRLDQLGRPSNAAEVIERLCVIAGLPLGELPEVTQAYLAAPTLVGRDQALADARALLLRPLKDRGATVLIEGQEGMGRSRLLDACVLEAKLLGATILRADAGDAGQGDYGVMRSLATQLLAAWPDFAREAARPHRALLSRVAPELSGDGAPSSPEAPERRHLQTALRDWLLAVARSKRLVLAVDDFDRIDEPSAALLATLAHKNTRRSLALLLTTETRAQSPALQVVRQIGHVVPIGPLSAEQTELLMRSVFGDVNHVVTLARRAHELSEGSPRAAMELAQHLVDQRVARYQAGSWMLPHTLGNDDLPRSLAATRTGRIARLSSDARELGEVLSLTDPAALSLQDYPALTLHGNAARIYRALDELVAAGILSAASERYSFSQRDWAPLLDAGLSAKRKRELHARIARIVERTGDPARLAHHLMGSGEVRRAIEVLAGLGDDPKFGVSSSVTQLLERAVEASEELGLPRAERLRLSVRLVSASSLRGDYDRFFRHAPRLLEQVKRDSGLADYYAMGETLPPDQRLVTAWTQAQQRYDAAPPAQRGFSPLEALERLTSVYAAFQGMAVMTLHAELAVDLPSLQPFAALSPQIEVLETSLNGIKQFVTARFTGAYINVLTVVGRLADPAKLGISEAQAKAYRSATLYLLGVLEAAMGLESAHERVAGLENEPGIRANAWRVRRVAHLMQGDFDGAAACQRQAELFELQDGAQQAFPGAVARIEVLAHWLTEDLIGLKQAAERIAEVAAVFPAWRNTLHIARAHYRRLQGDGAGALEELALVLPRVKPGADMDWPWAADAHVRALTAAGRHEEAVERCLEYCATCERTGIPPRGMARALIDALINVGRLQEACQLAEQCIKEAETFKLRGLTLGAYYEGRARVAIAMDDEPTFEHYAQRCAQEYQRGKNSSLSAKYERLMHEARRHGIGVSAELQRAAEFTPNVAAQAHEMVSGARTVQSRMPECVDGVERARYALTVLLETTFAEAGHLYALRGGQLQPLASLPEGEPPPGLREVLDQHVQEALKCESPTAVAANLRQTEIDGTPLATQPTATAWLGADGRRFEPVVLMAPREGELVIAAVAALSYGQSRRPLPRPRVLESLASALIENDDVDPLTCFA